MPFSSVLGANSVIRPGVCTSTTRPTVPYEGQLIYETDTDRVASYNGSAWVYGSFAGGLVLIKSQTIGTAVSSVTVSDVFSSAYDAYKIIITGGAASTNVDLAMQLGSSTASYYGSRFGSVYATGSASGQGVSNASSFTLAGFASTANIYFDVDVINPFLSKNTNIYSIGLYSTSFNGYGMFVGEHGVASSYTAFTLTTSTGTVTGGTIRVYGYANS